MHCKFKGLGDLIFWRNDNDNGDSVLWFNGISRKRMIQNILILGFFDILAPKWYLKTLNHGICNPLIQAC